MERSTVFGEQWDAILDAARTGADWAWEKIYDALAPTVLGYLRARGAADADGVMGEVFCQLVRDINRFEGDEAGFRSWVFVMAHHRLLDDVRRRQRRPEVPSAPEDMAGMRDSSDVEATVVDRTMREDLRSAMDVLTAAQREVLLLRIFGEMKIEDIAATVGRRVGAVKALQRRGLETLREEVVRLGLVLDPDGAEGVMGTQEYPSAPEGRLPHV